MKQIIFKKEYENYTDLYNDLNKKFTTSNDIDYEEFYNLFSENKIKTKYNKQAELVYLNDTTSILELQKLAIKNQNKILNSLFHQLTKEISPRYGMHKFYELWDSISIYGNKEDAEVLNSYLPFKKNIDKYPQLLINAFLCENEEVFFWYMEHVTDDKTAYDKRYNSNSILSKSEVVEQFNSKKSSMLLKAFQNQYISFAKLHYIQDIQNLILTNFFKDSELGKNMDKFFSAFDCFIQMDFPIGQFTPELMEKLPLEIIEKFIYKKEFKEYWDAFKTSQPAYYDSVMKDFKIMQFVFSLIEKSELVTPENFSSKKIKIL